MVTVHSATVSRPPCPSQIICLPGIKVAAVPNEVYKQIFGSCMASRHSFIMTYTSLDDACDLGA